MTIQPPLQVSEGLAARAWEYMSVDFSKPSRDIVALNRLGADGWEAVSMVTTWGVSEMRMAHPIVLLKRPLRTASEYGRICNSARRTTAWSSPLTQRCAR